MIIAKPHLCTRLQIWQPKYNTRSGEMEIWLSKAKVHHASPTIIVEFTKAKHLLNQRFAITRDKAQSFRETTNGKIPVYAVPLSILESYDTPGEVKAIVNKIWKD